MRKAAKGAAIMGVAAAGAAVALGVKSVQAAVSFEKTMARVQGLAGASAAQIAKWGDQLIALGPQLGKSPQELAEALYFVASSGIPASKAIDVVTVSAKAAAAGLGETEIVADAVTSVMNAYAASGMTAARATDVLVGIVREGKGEADAFAGVIGNVTALAAKLSVPFEEVGAALAAMTQLGTDPRVASVQLQAFFSSLLKTTPKAEKAARSVGLSFDDLRKTLSERGLLATLDKIREAFGNDTKAMAQAFPNIRALRGLLALAANDGGKVAGVFNRMADSSGSLGTAWGAAQETASLNMERFRASLDALQIAFGQGLLPVVTQAAQALAGKFADPAFVKRVRELGLVIGDSLLRAFTSISGWFSAHWDEIQGGFRTLGTIIKTVHKTAMSLKGVFIALTTPLRIQIKILMELWDKVLGGISSGAGILSHLPDFLGGGKFAGLQAAVDSARETMRDPLGGDDDEQRPELRRGGSRQPGRKRKRGIPRPANKGFGGREGGGRATGGPVMPGVAYRVGERGAEWFTPTLAGRVEPGGMGGGQIVVPVYLDGKQIAKVVTPHMERASRRTSAQTRGRHAGVNRFN